MLLQLAGGPAFTPARLARRLARIAGATGGTAEFVYFVQVTGVLGELQRSTLMALLNARAERSPGEGRTFVVVPRLGTVSPWSSKATDIAHNCGLESVKRI